MPKRRRRPFIPQFKAQVTLEALAGLKSPSEIARGYCQLLWPGVDSGGVLHLDPIDKLHASDHVLEAS